jgi:hypothetical protein
VGPDARPYVYEVWGLRANGSCRPHLFSSETGFRLPGRAPDCPTRSQWRPKIVPGLDVAPEALGTLRPDKDGMRAIARRDLLFGPITRGGRHSRRRPGRARLRRSLEVSVHALTRAVQAPCEKRRACLVKLCASVGMLQTVAASSLGGDHPERFDAPRNGRTGCARARTLARDLLAAGQDVAFASATRQP